MNANVPNDILQLNAAINHFVTSIHPPEDYINVLLPLLNNLRDVAINNNFGVLEEQTQNYIDFLGIIFEHYIHNIDGLNINDPNINGLDIAPNNDNANHYNDEHIIHNNNIQYNDIVGPPDMVEHYNDEHLYPE